MSGLPGEKVERYLSGECALLALAIQARTGWTALSAAYAN